MVFLLSGLSLSFGCPILSPFVVSYVVLRCVPFHLVLCVVLSVLWWCVVELSCV
jgi:hypothetical protein